MKTKPIPDGYHTATPYLVVKGAAKAIDFYKEAFGAKELMRMETPNGMIAHAEIQIGDSRIMLSDEVPQMGFVGPQSLNGSPVGLMLYVEDCDRVFNRAVAAGGSVQFPMQDKFYGDRSGSIKDPFGHQWTVATHVEDVAQDELRRRAQAHMHECMEHSQTASTAQPERVAA